MFYGHVGVALAAKPVAPKISLGVLLIAAAAIDILCGVFVVLGMEGMNINGSSLIPWSHGLFMSIVWSILAAGTTFLVSRNTRMSVVIGILVFSHWILDFISHPMGMGKSLPPDLPLLFENSPKVGLGLYNSIVAALITELGLLISGIIIYIKNTKANDRAGKWTFALFLIFLAVFPHTALLPSHLMFLTTFVLILLLPIGIWIDRHRSFVS